MLDILVVDDSPLERRLAGDLLERDTEFNVRYAEDGRQALEQMALAAPDLVLADIHMPEMDGLELVGKVRELYPLTPVVLMTSQGSEDVALAALRGGAASYTPKRELARDLLPTVHNVLRASRQQRGEARLMPFQCKSAYVFRLRNDVALIPPLVNLLREKVVAPVVPDEGDQLRCSIAFEEALTNALYHGNLELSSALRDDDDTLFYDQARIRSAEDPYKQRRIHVSASRERLGFRIVIRDDGPGFDPTTLPDPTDPANLERAHGRGLLLIKTFMDDVCHNEKGNEITMVKSA